MKIFESPGALLIPVKWRNALSMFSHLRQAYVLVIAPNKAEAERMIAANAGDATAWRLARGLRLRRGALSNSENLLLAAGIISREETGVFAYGLAAKDKPVIKIHPDGSCPIAGYFRYGNGTAGQPPGLYAERA